ncbi:MAG: ABC transporter ATP-binding protein [Desulfobacterales bacterium]|jgi:branched-chain amino acid transport system ATP-binding protein|nr:ABC transporter ATP-binding protein [Desulfobacterales bacterium]
MTELIATHGLTKRFNGLTAVHQVDFRVNAGQTSGIIGPNGSGKTTLFNLLSGYFAPTEGAISFQGRDITRTQPHARVALGIGRTFQLVSVFTSLTVWENLVLANLRFQPGETSLGRFFFRTARRARVLADCARALEWVGLADQAGAGVDELSYGDKRMLEIGIVASLKPRLLLLDEPLAGLSDHEINRVVEMIEGIRKRVTVVIIEHKISKIVDVVERLSVMNEGRLICEGTPEEVLCNPQVRECYWGKEGEAC